ncbi:MAG TPA: nucleotide exchange factor GrpE [Aliiroseovarius sp.]|nr:nucleotide exchange factor GrpE [Aliiroseovarius sp.]
MSDAENNVNKDVQAAIDEIMGDQASEASAEQADMGDEADEVNELRAELDEMRNRFMRALADAENARKRGEKDRREAERYGGSKLARDMLPVYDNLKRALEAAGDNHDRVGKAFLEGVDLTMRELLNIFDRHGITLVSPKIGDKFDPDFHQAMFEAAVPGTRAGEIIQVMNEGFKLHNRLLRPAQVGVSSNTEKGAENGQSPSTSDTSS